MALLFLPRTTLQRVGRAQKLIQKALNAGLALMHKKQSQQNLIFRNTKISKLVWYKKTLKIYLHKKSPNNLLSNFNKSWEYNKKKAQLFQLMILINVITMHLIKKIYLRKVSKNKKK